jgi:hypothetical protein
VGPKPGGQGVERRADRGVVPEVPGLGPLPAAVKPHRLIFDRRLDTKVGGQVVQGLLPKAVLHPVGEQHHAQLEQRVVGAHEHLHLGDRDPVFFEGTEGVPAGKRVSFGSHDRERHRIGVQDHHPAGQPQVAG